MLITTESSWKCKSKLPEVSPPPCQNGSHQIDNKEQVLVRVWSSGDPRTLRVGMRFGAATVEDSTEGPQQMKGRTIIQSRSEDTCLKEKETLTFKDTRTSIYVHNSTACRSQKIRTLPKCPSVMDAGDVVYVHRISLSHGKERNRDIRSNVDELEGIILTMNKSEKDK